MAFSFFRTVRDQILSDRPVVRFLRWLGAGIVVLFAVYLIAVNVVIKTGALSDLIVEAAGEVHEMTLDGAYSPYPGRVHADGFMLKFEDSAIQFLLEIDDLRVDIDLLALTQREFRASGIRGKVRYYLSSKVKQVEGNEKRLDSFPKIAGLEFPPVSKKEKAPGDEDPDTWTVVLSDIDISSDDLWFMEYHYEGRARVTGKLDIRPKRRLAVPRARVVFESGQLAIGEKPVLSSSVKGRVEFSIAEHDPDGLEGESILDYSSASVRLDVDGIELERAARLYPFLAAHAISTDDARLSVDARMKRGKIDAGSKAKLHAGKAAGVAKAFRIEGPVDADARVEPGGKLSAKMSSRRLDLALSKPSEHEGPTVDQARVEASVDGRHLTGDWSIDKATVSVKSIAIPELAWLNGALETDVFHSGSAKGHLDVTREPSGALKGEARLGFENAGVEVRDTPLLLSGSAAVADRAGPSSNSYQVETIRLKLDDIVVGEDREHRWWLSAVSKNATVSTDGSFAATFDIGAESLDPLVPLLIESNILQAATKALLELDDTEATVVVDRSNERLRVKVDRFVSGNLSTRGTMLKYNGATCGAFFVDTPVTDVGVDISPGRGVSVEPFVDSSWIESQLQRPCRSKR